MKQNYFTLNGLKKLKQEFKELKEEKRSYLVKRITQAREMGDLSENSEYASAREELSMLDGRLKKIENLLRKAKVIKKNNKKGVSLGSEVLIRVNKKTYTFIIVGEWEADPLKKKISHKSPLGKALLGKKVGEKVEIKAPVGTIVYEIKKIS